jgi:hypothetical protein
MVALEALVEEQLAYANLRRYQVGAAAHTAFEADPARWDTVEVLAFPAGSEATACALRDELRGGANLLELAARELGRHAAASRAARCIALDVLPRHAITTLDHSPLVMGTVVAARLRGAGPYVAVVRGVTPARWDDPIREAVEQALFDEWMRESRARACVEWNWGATPE